MVLAHIENLDPYFHWSWQERRRGLPKLARKPGSFQLPMRFNQQNEADEATISVLK